MKMNPMIMFIEKNLETVSDSNIFYTFPPKKKEHIIITRRGKGNYIFLKIIFV